MTDYGINQDGDGNIVGLWFAPERAIQDEHVYINLTPAEIMALSFDRSELQLILEALRTALDFASPGIFATQGADQAAMTAVYRRYGDLSNLVEKVAASISTGEPNAPSS